MFEAAEVGRTLSKADFKRLEPSVHNLFLQLQRRLRNSNKSLVIIISGVEGAGKGEVVDALNRWFDTRDVQTHAFWDETDEESQRPRYWKYWRHLPRRGGIGVMFDSWYAQPIVDRVFGKIDESEFDQELNKISALEQTLSNDGTIFAKLWFHLPKDVQHSRLEDDTKIRKFKKSPFLKKFSKIYNDFSRVSDCVIRLSDTAHAPWNIIEASDSRYRDIEAGNTIISILQERLAPEASQPEPRGGIGSESSSRVQGVMNAKPANLTALDTVDLSCILSKQEYKQRLDQYQLRLHQLAWQMYRQKRNAVLLFEGWDAGGKGSAIRRVTAAVDARLYRVIPIAAPSDEEKGHHYLWRFWRHIPRAGYMSIYDRSWYGRVLVERVEGFAEAQEWQRSYQEINEFESHLLDHGVALFKFWIHISPEEQLRRFKEREKDPRKQYKITGEDWRNREKWDDYEVAVNDMLAHTSTDRAPWTLISGNNKLHARIQILETICEGLENYLLPERG